MSGLSKAKSLVRKALVAHWSIRSHSLSYKVIQGDSTKAEAYQILFKNEQSKADVLITDPPYCLLERRRLSGELRDEKVRKRKTDHQPEVPRFSSLSDYRDFTTKWMNLSISFALKPKASLIIWTNRLGKEIIIDVCRSDFKYDYVDEFIWAKRTIPEKASSSISDEIVLRCYESALVFQKRSSHAVQVLDSDEVMIHGKKVKKYQLPWSLISDYHDVDASPKNTSVPLHPCRKPLSVLKPLVSTWAKETDVIFDPFSGSGSILQSCMSLNGKVKSRSYVGIEILDDWVKEVGRIAEG
jgi:site-specific DNA-methyltransferase (adenine-specific)